LRKELVIDRTNAVRWYERETSYRAILRVDGQGGWEAPITPAHGDDLSWVVTLDARA
jgi:hypothetical protein